MTDAELLRQIVKALAEGRADIAFSPGLESHMDFPGNSETDKGQFIIAGLALIGLAYWPASRLPPRARRAARPRGTGARSRPS